MQNIKISVDDLHKLLKCNFDKGTLAWRERSQDVFLGGAYPSSRACKAWNAKMANKPAFTAELGCGYKVGRIYKKSYRAHRVIYAMFFGEWPKFEIDHIDGNPRNNSIRNLRDVCPKTNRRNMRLYSTNKSGVSGVTWSDNARKWHSRISADTGVLHLGYFDDLGEAISVRLDAEKKHGFHSNHGRTDNLLTDQRVTS